MNEAYLALKQRFARIATLGEAASILHWDAAVMMPSGAAVSRGEQLATLAGLGHALLTAPEVADELRVAEAGDDAWDEANLALMHRAHQRAAALPGALVEASTRANSACEAVWRQARPASDFALVRPMLEEVVRLQRESAAALADATGLSPYDVLMDGYGRGVGAVDVEPVFDAYEAFLREALPHAEEIQARRPAAVEPEGPFPVEVQRALCRRISERVGLDYDHARLDESAHPFSGGTPQDARITTRYEADSFAPALLGVLHETGHALYERGLPESWARQPVGTSAGMAAHESQSLIVEMQASRSDPFLRWLGPELHACFGGDPVTYAPANLAGLWRRVERGFIRVNADELTYPAHIILRFRLERALIGGTLDVADLPGAWNSGMRDLLGITPPDDARGCLQDIHWYDGAFGYFPSYTLGAMAAAQMMAAARDALPGLDEVMERGDLSPLVAWLRASVHGRASLVDFHELMIAATGRPLGSEAFTHHLRARYLQG